MSNIVEQHFKVCTELNDLYEKKNHDYGNSFSATFKKLGIISAVTRITDKCNRLTELAVNAKQKVVSESIRDTLIDLANYAIMTIMELDNEKDCECGESLTSNNVLKSGGAKIPVPTITVYCGGECYDIEDSSSVICDFCKHKDVSAFEEPCGECVHNDGTKRKFELDI